MYERTRSPSSGYPGCTNATAKMANDIGPRKTMFVLVVVVGCFAILWPKVFYPMLVGSANQHLKPSPIDKTTGCCDVFSEGDIDTIKIMSELCSNIIQQSNEKPLSGKEIVTKCKSEIQQTCGIDISDVLQEQIRLGRPVKQILNEVRSLNGSLCLKYHYGVAPWRLGVPHRITINFTTNIRQERPPHMRPDIVHPAFRERGSAIPRPDGPAKKPPKVIEGRPGPLPGMRPTLGGAGHVVPPSQKTGSSMSVIMPIYTIGIVIFFTYTLMKLLFKKQPEGVGGSLYPPIEPDSRFRKEVFESERCKFTPRLSRDPTGKIGWKEQDARWKERNARDELDHLRNRLQETEKAMERIVDQMSRVPLVFQAKSSSDHSLANGNLANGSVPKHEDQEQTSVKILGMETTASCEGGEKWNKPTEPVIPVPHPVEPPVPPQEIYLEGALPAQSQILVAESAVVTEPAPYDHNSDPAVVLAGKMTLSVISLDSLHDIGKVDEKIEDPIEIEPIDLLELNGEHENIEDDALEESKYTTASSATAAENEISEDEGTDNEGIEEDIEKINDLELEINHITDTNGPETDDFVEEEIIDKDIREELQREIAKEIQEELDRETAKAIQQDLEKKSDEDILEQLEREALEILDEKIDQKEKKSDEDILEQLEREALEILDEKIDQKDIKEISEEPESKIAEEIQQELKNEVAEEILRETDSIKIPEEKIEIEAIKEILEELEKEAVEKIQEKLEKDAVKELQENLERGKDIDAGLKKVVIKKIQKEVMILEPGDEDEIIDVEAIDVEDEEVEEEEIEEDEVEQEEEKEEEEEEEEEVEEEEEEEEEVEIDDDEDVEEIEIEVDEDEVNEHKSNE